MRIKIGTDYDGRTVKDWLYRNGISRTLITRLKKLDGGITVNGIHATVRRVLASDDVLELALRDTEADLNSQLIPAELPLDILYEDSELIAINKPAGIPTHPSLGHYTDTLANGLAYYFVSRGVPFVFRAVNRLDRETSGIVLVAKSQYSASVLTGLMQSGRIRKTYTAVLNGVPSPPSGTIDSFIRRRTGTIMLREVCEPHSADIETTDAKEAVTLYETLASGMNGAIVRAEPVTGRTHQLRVHFASIGTPIAGDGLYGSAEAAPTSLDRAISRHALHASKLVIERDGGKLILEAKLPPDMERLCAMIRGSGSIQTEETGNE